MVTPPVPLEPTRSVSVRRVAPFETMMLPEGVSDVIYNRALRIIADQVLPPVDGSLLVRFSPWISRRVSAQSKRRMRLQKHPLTAPSRTMRFYGR